MRMQDFPGFAVNTGADMTGVVNDAIEYSHQHGEELVFPAGQIQVGTLILRSGVTLRCEVRGATKFIHNVQSAPMFTLPIGNVENIVVEKLQFIGNDSSDEHGFDLMPVIDPASPSEAVFQYVVFDQISLFGFGGKAFRMVGSYDLSDANLKYCQFVTFRDVLVLRAAQPNSRCLSVVGTCGQLYFEGACQFDEMSFGQSPSRTAGYSVCFSRPFTRNSVVGDAADSLVQPGWTLAADQAPIAWRSRPPFRGHNMAF